MAGQVPEGAREVCSLAVTKEYAAVLIEPNRGEESDSNFPRNLHNAAELLLAVGHVESAQRLQQCTSRVGGPAPARGSLPA